MGYFDIISFSDIISLFMLTIIEIVKDFVFQRNAITIHRNSFSNLLMKFLYICMLLFIFNKFMIKNFYTDL